MKFRRLPDASSKVPSSQQQPGNSESSGSSGCKLDRKPSLRRKFGALIRGSADLPAAINRGLQPIRRSLSFSKDLNRVYETQPAAHQHHSRTRSAQWYNSLGSLAENEPKDEDDENTQNNNKNNLSNDNSDDDEEADGEMLAGIIIGRTHSLMEKNPVSSIALFIYLFIYMLIHFFIICDQYRHLIEY